MPEPINIADRRKKKNIGAEFAECKEEMTDADWEANIRANKAKQEKLARERASANTGVKKSYNLKGKK